ncbi:MAG: ATP-binding protein [Deltaproteobacteria bacterium]
MAERTSGAIERWRARILDTVLMIAFATTTLALIARGAEDLTYGVRVETFFILPAWVAIAVGCLHRGASPVTRKILLVAGCIFGITLSAARTGFLVPNVFVATLMISVWAALFLESRGTWLTWVITLAAWLGVATFCVVTETHPSEPALDPSLPSSWVRILVVYATLSAGTIASVRYLVTRMESSARHAEALVEALERESGERIAALHDQRQLEVQLEQSQKLEALGTLAGGVAHDFNNLLVVILNNAEFITEDAENEDVAEAARDIGAAAERATALTQQLLAFGRQRVEHRAPIDVDDSMAESVRILSRVLPERISVETHLGTDLPRVWGPPTAVEQIFLNLCVNARDAIEDTGTIEIRTEHVRRCAPHQEVEADFVLLSVRDDGCGMSPDTLRRIFDPFFTTKALGQGTGLGLSVVHGLAQQCGGFVEVESTPGVGTRFDVFLAAHGERTISADLVERPDSRGGGETILVVDDDDAVRDVLVHMLERAGYTTVVARDGRDGVQRFTENADTIRLVVTDVVMPHMGALGMHEAIAPSAPHLPFIVVSGYAPETLDESFFERPGRTFLAKPFSARDLLGAVRAALDAAPRPAARKEAAAPTLETR